jgi:hypothetical protein
MKAHELIKQLMELPPDEPVCALVWTKAEFDFNDEYDELELTPEGWQKVCDDFYSSLNVLCHTIDESLNNAVLDYAIEKSFDAE